MNYLLRLAAPNSESSDGPDEITGVIPAPSLLRRETDASSRPTSKVSELRSNQVSRTEADNDTTSKPNQSRAEESVVVPVLEKAI